MIFCVSKILPPFFTNFYLYLFEFGSSGALKYHETERIIDDLFAINYANEFSNFCKYICPKEFELNIEHQGTHASFLSLDISTKDGMFIYKLYKIRLKISLLNS